MDVYMVDRCEITESDDNTLCINHIIWHITTGMRGRSPRVKNDYLPMVYSMAFMMAAPMLLPPFLPLATM